MVIREMVVFLLNLKLTTTHRTEGPVWMKHIWAHSKAQQSTFVSLNNMHLLIQ